MSNLEEVIRDFVDFYNHWKCPKMLNNVTPTDMVEGHMEAILARRKVMQLETFERRRRYHQAVWETSKTGVPPP